MSQPPHGLKISVIKTSSQITYFWRRVVSFKFCINLRACSFPTPGTPCRNQKRKSIKLKVFSAHSNHVQDKGSKFKMSIKSSGYFRYVITAEEDSQTHECLSLQMQLCFHSGHLIAVNLRVLMWERERERGGEIEERQRKQIIIEWGHEEIQCKKASGNTRSGKKCVYAKISSYVEIYKRIIEDNHHTHTLSDAQDLVYGSTHFTP